MIVGWFFPVIIVTPHRVQITRHFSDVHMHLDIYPDKVSRSSSAWGSDLKFCNLSVLDRRITPRPALTHQKLPLPTLLSNLAQIHVIAPLASHEGWLRHAPFSTIISNRAPLPGTPFSVIVMPGDILINVIKKHADKITTGINNPVCNEKLCQKLIIPPINHE